MSCPSESWVSLPVLEGASEASLESSRQHPHQVVTQLLLPWPPWPPPLLLCHPSLYTSIPFLHSPDLHTLLTPPPRPWEAQNGTVLKLLFLSRTLQWELLVCRDLEPLQVLTAGSKPQFRCIPNSAQWASLTCGVSLPSTSLGRDEYGQAYSTCIVSFPWSPFFSIIFVCVRNFYMFNVFCQAFWKRLMVFKMFLFWDHLNFQKSFKNSTRSSWTSIVHRHHFNILPCLLFHAFIHIYSDSYFFWTIWKEAVWCCPSPLYSHVYFLRIKIFSYITTDHTAIQSRKFNIDTKLSSNP